MSILKSSKIKVLSLILRKRGESQSRVDDIQSENSDLSGKFYHLAISIALNQCQLDGLDVNATRSIQDVYALFQGEGNWA